MNHLQRQNLLMEAGAELSPCRRYRYTLTRRWDARLPNLLYVLLNPSRGDELLDDATITRCIERARRLGYGGMMIVNLFAWRAEQPIELRRIEDPVGPGNDAAILRAAQACDAVICGWGAHADAVQPGRARQVLLVLASLGLQPQALAVNKDGSPQHPLYVDYEARPRPLPVPEA